MAVGSNFKRELCFQIGVYVKPTMLEIETVVNVMFEHSKTDACHAECIQYYPTLIDRVKKLTLALDKISRTPLATKKDAWFIDLADDALENE
jgi:hypothetical protein